MQSDYCVVIGDISKSRELRDRAAIQERFKAAIEEINQRFTDFIVSRFLVTIGDEFQGVLNDVANSYDVIVAMRELLYPVQFVFGVGVGTITTEIAPEAIGMDGPAFHNARAALEEGKEEGYEVRYRGLGEPFDYLINAMLVLIEALKRRWTERQFKVISIYRQTGSQAEVARRLKVSRAAISQTLAAAGWDAVAVGEDALRRLLSTGVQKSF
ncbi:MAG TPA: hypothetical protein DCP08_06780 [Chloroflexi bacterium]|nr:hypothetical protein [Chloroflexota bacterium]